MIEDLDPNMDKAQRDERFRVAKEEFDREVASYL